MEPLTLGKLGSYCTNGSKTVVHAANIANDIVIEYNAKINTFDTHEEQKTYMQSTITNINNTIL